MASGESIRKALAEAVEETAHVAFQMTGKSINALPEYFLSVKVADCLYKRFKTYTYSMEDSMSDVLDELDLEYVLGLEHLRESGRPDLTLRSSKRRSLMHVVEFKRNMRERGLQGDFFRMAALCANAPSDHRARRNYVVAVTTLSRNTLENRHKNLEDLTANEFGDSVTSRMEPLNLSGLFSTKRKTKGKPLAGAVWELKYSD